MNKFSENGEDQVRSSLVDLTTYLRDNPGGGNATELSVKFGLPIEFIENVQLGLSGPIQRESVAKKLGKLAKSIYRWILSAFNLVSGGLGSFTDKLTKHPFAFVFISGGLLVFMYLIYRGLPPASAPYRTLITNFGLATLLVVYILHMMCFYRQARARYPLIAGFVLFIGIATLVLVSLATTPQVRFPLVPSLVASAILSGSYTLIGVSVSIVGGIAQLNRRAILDRKMTRQELVGRLLEVESLLSRTPASALKQVRQDGFIERARSMVLFPLFALIVGLFYGVFVVSVIGTYYSLLFPADGLRETIEQQRAFQSGSFVISIVLFCLSFVVYGGVGFLSGSVGRSILSVSMATVGQLAAELVPYGEFGPSYVSQQLSGNSLIQLVLYTVLMGVFSGFAGSIHANQDKQKRLSKNDPALLVAEAVQLQWRLNLGSRAACVMSVDVAGSTKLKAQADPLRIEYSFREYQDMVAELSKRHGGHVFSTAGDGAIVAFPNSEMALEAGRDIQSELPNFNQKRNRLDSDFRLRVGLHTGETKAELGDAPFNELIDIAAHIEKVAPVGGIAVSGQTAAKLPDESLVELAHAIDGQSVFIVQDPVRT